MKQLFDKLGLKYINSQNIDKLDLNQLTDNTACSKCKGACCKQSGCAYAPSNFKNLTFEALKKELDKGHISIIADYTENDFEKAKMLKNGNPPVLHLMARNCERNIVNLASRPCRCASLTETGCIHSIENRPLGGLLLIPKNAKTRGYCTSIFNIEYARIQWAQPEIQNILKAFVVHYTANGKTFDEIHLDAIEEFGFREKLTRIKGGKFSQWAEDRLALYKTDLNYAKYIRRGEKRAELS